MSNINDAVSTTPRLFGGNASQSEAVVEAPAEAIAADTSTENVAETSEAEGSENDAPAPANVEAEETVAEQPLAVDAPEPVEPVEEVPFEEVYSGTPEQVSEAEPVAMNVAVSADGKSVEELAAEREALDKQIAEKQNAQKAVVINQIINVANTYGVTVNEIVDAMGGLVSKRKGSKAKPKYRDPSTGAVWSGRGKSPLWIKDVPDRTKFLITD